jgi:mannose/fructose/N-acetylgalactosamine-specific phosphotransferase system component IID
LSEDSYRPLPASRALRRARLIVNLPLAVAMAVMLLAGYRLGLSIYRLDDATVTSEVVVGSILWGLVVATWIAVAISVHPDNGRVAAWLLGCGLSLVLGLTLGSWP